MAARETWHHLFRPLRAAADNAARCLCHFPQKLASEFGFKMDSVEGHSLKALNGIQARFRGWVAVNGAAMSRRRGGIRPAGVGTARLEVTFFVRPRFDWRRA